MPIKRFLKAQVKHICFPLIKSCFQLTAATQLLWQRFTKALTDHSCQKLVRLLMDKEPYFFADVGFHAKCASWLKVNGSGRKQRKNTKKKEKKKEN